MIKFIYKDEYKSDSVDIVMTLRNMDSLDEIVEQFRCFLLAMTFNSIGIDTVFGSYSPVEEDKLPGPWYEEDSIDIDDNE